MMGSLEMRRLRRMVWSTVSNAALRSREREEEWQAIISWMVDRIKEVNVRGVMFAISDVCNKLIV